VLVLWLNDDATVGSNGSGLRLFSPASSDCLTRQGTIVYPSYHPDFLSQRGSLFINMSSNPCLGSSSSSQQEWIPAVSNRLVLVNSQRPVLLEQMMMTKKKRDKKVAAVASGDQSSSLSVALTARVKVMTRRQ
jgi:hypothetical protein